MLQYEKIVDAFQGIPTGNICDSNERRGSMTSAITGLNRKFAVTGRAMTVRCHPGDNLTIHKAIHQARPGAVLVIDCGGFVEAGCFGEMFAISCRNRGIRGVVIDGACRDKNALIDMNFPVYSRAVCPNGTTKEILGQIDVPIVCGGIPVEPDDIVVADCDGVVVIPRAKAEEVLEKAQKKLEFEETILGPQLAKGKTTVELMGLAKKLGLEERADG